MALPLRAMNTLVVFINGEPKNFCKNFFIFQMIEQVEFSRFVRISGFFRLFSGFPGSEKVKPSAIHSRRSRNAIEKIFFGEWSLKAYLWRMSRKIRFVDVSDFRFVDDSSKNGYFGYMGYYTWFICQISPGFWFCGLKFDIDHPCPLIDHWSTTKR